MEKAKVYFTRKTDSNAVIACYEILNAELKGKIACKIHSGEQGNQNYLRPEFMKPIIDRVKGTIVENNTAYPGARNTTQKHKELIKDHGWSTYFDVDLLDAEDNDIVLDIPDGVVLTKNYIGGETSKYDSMLVLSHFKGHPMGGYGGALKQLSIGCASSRGKAYIHSAGRTLDQYHLWDDLPPQNAFLEAMADSASSVHKYFKSKGGIAYVSMMMNMSVDCDCCEVAEDPCLKDIGILSSLDPVALDQACIDLVQKSGDPGVAHFMERVNSRNGLLTIEASEKLGIGTREYDLISID